MKDRDKVCIEKINHYCREIMSFCDGISYKDFADSNMLKFSCSFALAQIGDLVKQLSEKLKERHSEVPWHKVAGFRNRVIHEYDKINPDVLWEINNESIPELLIHIEEILKDMHKEDYE